MRIKPLTPSNLPPRLMYDIRSAVLSLRAGRDQRTTSQLTQQLMALRSQAGARAFTVFEAVVAKLAEKPGLSWQEADELWNTYLFHGLGLDETEAQSQARKDGTVFGATSYLQTKGLLHSVELKDGEKVCDIGSGLGHFCLAGALLYRRSKFVGLEVLPSFIGSARALAGHYQPRNLRFVPGDALTFNYAGFDVLHLYTPMTQTSAMDFYNALGDRLAATMKRGARLITVGLDDPMNPDGPFPDTAFMRRFKYRLTGGGEGAPVIYTR